MKIILDSYIQEVLTEDYPSNWSIEEFAKLKSFAARKQYCESLLQRISSGSSRIVYKIDESKVLKLAKNTKGISQNEMEVDSYDYYFSKILAEIFNYDKDYLWVEMELATPCTKSVFKNITGYSFEDFSATLSHFYYDYNPRKYRSNSKPNIPEETIEKIHDDEFYNNVCEFMLNYDMPVGDLVRTSSYGVVLKDGHRSIVLVDYGLNQNVYDTHYKK
jgi:hypothetical protein